MYWCACRSPSTADYRKGQMIYNPGTPPKSIYLVLNGKVARWHSSTFPAAPNWPPLENIRIMAWDISDVENLVMMRPRLAVGLMQVLVQRNVEFVRRIESFSTESIEQRLARALLRFSERLGTPAEDGASRMMPLTHALLSRYVGTSREIVTHHMIRFRRQGSVSYSRHGIVLHRDAIQSFLDYLARQILHVKLQKLHHTLTPESSRSYSDRMSSLSRHPPHRAPRE